MSGVFEAIGGLTGRLAGGAGGGLVGGVGGGAIGTGLGAWTGPGAAISGATGAAIGARAGAFVGSSYGGEWGASAGDYLDSTGFGQAVNDKAKALKDWVFANKKADEKSAADQKECTGSCKKQNLKNPCEHLKKGQGAGDYRGGAHGDPKKGTGTSSPSGDELFSHHTPAKDAYKGSGLDPADGPAIQMLQEDHVDTHTYGRGGLAGREAQRKLLEGGNFDQAFELDVDDIKQIAKDRGDPQRYDEAIKEARAYKDCLKKHGITPGSGGKS